MAHDARPGFAVNPTYRSELPSGVAPGAVQPPYGTWRSTIVGHWHRIATLRQHLAHSPSQIFSLVVNASGRNVRPACSVRWCCAATTSNTRWLQNMMTKELSAHTDFPDHHAVGMVVDDDALIRETVAQVLEDLCDQVYQAADGQEGLEILAQHPDISVIVTDIAMPRLDGIAFASKARRLHPELKVLFVSGMQRPPGSEEFLAKPFRAIALVSALNQLMNVH